MFASILLSSDVKEVDLAKNFNWDKFNKTYVLLGLDLKLGKFTSREIK